MPKQHLTNDTWFMIQYAFVILVFLLLLWFLSRFIVKIGQGKQQGRNIQVMEVVRVGQDSFVYIVRVFDKFYVISQSKNAMLHLDTLDAIAEKELAGDFGSFLGKMREKYSSRKNDHAEDGTQLASSVSDETMKEEGISETSEKHNDAEQ